MIGPEFPGLDPAERPAWLVGPPWTEDSLGARVDGLLRWSLDPDHDIDSNWVKVPDSR